MFLTLKRFTTYTIVLTAVFVCSGLLPGYTYGQQNDVQKDSLVKKNHNIFQWAINAVTRSKEDSLKQAAILNIKSETVFLPYNGKIIRHITIQQFGFEKTFQDTSESLKYKGTQLLNSLHRNTREQVIQNNLFIKENTVLDAYKVADNERHLRSLEYIQDARILVNEIEGATDSVDIVVITKDLFSIQFELNDLNPHRFKAKLGDANVAGLAQKVQLTTLLQQSRSPAFGYELLYSKNNISNSFINATAAYTTINPDITTAAEDEHAWNVSFERPLVSQYMHIAGGLDFGQNKAVNNYNQPDSLFYKYHYNTFDTWLGYNLGIKKHSQSSKIYNRTFISARYFHDHFTDTPYQLTNPYNFRYDNKQAMLAQFTFFRQTFYKTNYIFGFGTTEDIPLGYNIALTGGWYKQSNLKRPYVGLDANRYVISNKGDFIQYFVRSGSYFNDGKLQDAGVLLGTSIFTRLMLMRNIKIRQYIRFSYTKQFNRLATDALTINNPFGLRYFNSDSLLGDQRISLHTETFFFINYKFLGFKFAPFIFGDVAILKPENQKFSKSGLYYGLGGGVRIRNENLVFNTVEMRFVYFPRKTEGNNSFKLTLAANIRFRYNSNYVKAPDIIQLNNDDANNIY